MTARPSEEAVRAHLDGARAPVAAGPGPDAERLRRAYLDLLKLALCDLTGVSTQSVGAMPDGTVLARELRGDARRIRAAGLDWPLQGTTMVGLGRLDDLQACVESVVAGGVPGDAIEIGAWRGGASILMRAALDCLGDERTVWVADSFQGFPAGDAAGLSAFDFLAAPLEEVEESFARFGCERGVRFVPGFFADTLPRLPAGPWALMRLDADAYEPTRDALRRLYPGLAAGGHVIVDDYGSFAECRRAVDEFREEHGISEPLEHVDSTCVRWRREHEAPVEAPALAAPAWVGSPPAAKVASAPPPPTAVARPRHPHVPTAREVELLGELAALRERLAEAQEGRLRRRARAIVRRAHELSRRSR
jgi:hypothetical protein